MEDLALILIILNPNLAANYECLILNPQFYYVPLLCTNFYGILLLLLFKTYNFSFKQIQNFIITI